MRVQGCKVAMGCVVRGWGCLGARDEPAGVHHRAGTGSTLQWALSPCTARASPGKPRSPPGNACWGILLSGARQPHQDALDWRWKRLSPHECSLMEPALPCSPVPLGSGSPANAALRGVGVSWCLLHLPFPLLGRCWLAPRPLSHGDGSSTGAEGRGESLQALLAGPGKLCKTKRLLIYFFLPCPSPFSLMDLRFVSLGKEVPAGVRCQRGTFVYPSRCGGCSPPGPRVLRARGWVPTTLGTEPRHGCPDAIGALLQRVFADCLCREFAVAK